MRTRRQATIQDLRIAIDCLPRHTRAAMLVGLRANDIIAGAYSNGDGICPMLAAHRAGGRTDFISFSRAWDQFALGGKRRRLALGGTRRLARRATPRELLILAAHLQASLAADDGHVSELGAAIAEHRALAEQRAGRAEQASRRAGDPHRAGELREHQGWSWLRVMRRYDEYRQVLAAIQAEPVAPSSDTGAPQVRDADCAAAR